MNNAMYAKLFARIAQSSLMEQDVETRYCFMMLLAIADIEGEIIGTDIAISRSINLPLESFKKSVMALMEPDPDSNSQVMEGRRICASENGRGYRVVNYKEYRSIKTAEEKRIYMREYMRERRKKEGCKTVSFCKKPLSDVTHAEAEEETEAEAEPLHSAEWSPPSKVEFIGFYVSRLPCLGKPLSLKEWLSEQFDYLSKNCWPKGQHWNTKAHEYSPRYRSRHAEIKIKSGKAEYSEDFELFWNAYPRKVGKGNAWNAWRKAGVKFADCAETLAKWADCYDWKKDAGQFVPHPATWINGRRWEDGPPPANVPQPKNGQPQRSATELRELNSIKVKAYDPCAEEEEEEELLRQQGLL